MALSLRSLIRITQISPGSAAGEPTPGVMLSYHLYGTADAAAVVEAAGYFNSARALLRVGDIINATMVYGGTPVTKTYVVLTVPATGNVTIGLQATAAG